MNRKVPGRSRPRNHARRRKPAHLEQFFTLYSLLCLVAVQALPFSFFPLWGSRGAGDPPLVMVVSRRERPPPRQESWEKGA